METFRSLCGKCRSVAILLVLLGALSAPARAQTAVFTGQVAGLNGNTAILVDADGNTQSFYFQEHTYGYPSMMQIGDWVRLTYFPATGVVDDVTFVEGPAALHPAHLRPARIHYYHYYHIY